MKRHKKAWLLALILFCSLAFSKMALAQTTVKDIQKRGELIVGQARCSQLWLQRS